MVPPKYNFYIGELKENFATRPGSISTAGIYEENSSYRSSQIVPVPDSRLIYIVNKPIYSSTARIAYYDIDNNFIAFNYLAKGLNKITRANAVSYAITYQYNDGAFTNDYFLAELEPVIPHYKTLSKKYAKESGQEFFRTSLDGKVTLFGQDYELINNGTIESKFIFCINKLSDTTENLYYAAIFNKADCKFNGLKKSCELTSLVTQDAYVNILNKYEDTYDLIKVPPRTTSVNISKRCAVQIYIGGGNTVSTYFNGTYVEEDVESPIDNDTTLQYTYHFALADIFNELHVSSVPGSTYASGLFIEDGDTWVNTDGYKLSFAKVASAGDSFKGSYAQETIYNINTGATVNNQQVLGSDETSTVVFRNDTYALRLISNNGSTIIGESVILFYMPSGSSLYISGFNSIQMKALLVEDSMFTIDQIFVYKVWQRLLCDVDMVSGINTYDISLEDFAYTRGNYKKVIGLEDTVLGEILHSMAVQSEPTKYGKNDNGDYFTDNFVSSVAGLGRLLPVCRSSWANTSIWFAYNETIFDIIETSARKVYTLKDAYNIGDVIKVLLKQIDPAIRHEPDSTYSKFLYGTGSTNSPQFHVFITPKSNILKGEYDQAAQKAEITLKDVMDMLAKCFQCYWYINDDNQFIIEHIDYFNKGLSYTATNNFQLNLTTLSDMFNKKISANFQQEIEYNRSDLAKRYEFSWMDEGTEIFDGVTMDINSNYVQQDKTESVSVGQFSSDIDFMLYNPDDFSEDGFALLCPTSSGSYYSLPIVQYAFIDEQQRSYTSRVQNLYASWSWIANNLYRYNMPAQRATINTIGPVTAFSIIRSMSHKVEFFSENDPDELLLIRTAFGNGKIDDMSINLDTRLVKASLMYKP